MDRGTWWAIVHGVENEWDMTKLLNNNKLCVSYEEKQLLLEKLCGDGTGMAENYLRK